MSAFRVVACRRFNYRQVVVLEPLLRKRYFLVRNIVTREYPSRPLTSAWSNQVQKRCLHEELSIEEWNDERLEQSLYEIWSNLRGSRNQEMVDRSLNILEQLLRYERRQGIIKLVQDGVIAKVLINVYRNPVTKRKETVQGLHRIQMIIGNNDEFWKHSLSSHMLRAVTFRGSNRGDNQLKEIEEQVLNDIVTKYGQYFNPENFGIALHGFAVRGMAQRAASLLKVLDRILHSPGSTASDESAITKCYNCVLNALAKSRGRDASKRAEVLLQRMENSPLLHPDVVSYSSLLDCYERRGMDRKAELLLSRMLHQREKFKNELTALSFNIVIKALQRSSRKDAPLRAERVFNAMLNMRSQGFTGIHPDRFSVSAVLGCYANHDRAEDAYRFLRRTHEMYLDGDIKDAPSTQEYNCFLNALAKSKHALAPEKADEVLKLMSDLYASGHHELKPDEMTYSFVLHCHARNGNTEKALNLLRKMHDLHNRGLLSNGPNGFAYNVAINAIATSNMKDAPELAKALVYRMKLFAVEQPQLEPDVVTYNSLLKVFKNAGMVNEAEETLQEMITLHARGDLEGGPDAVSYRNVIQILANSGDREALLRAERLFEKVLSLHVSGEETFGSSLNNLTILLDGYANLGMAQEAERLIQRIRALNTSGKLATALNTISYNCVMNALANCHEWDAPERAEALVSQMQKSPSTAPCLITYNSLLQVYANEGMVSKAENTLQEMYDLYKKGKLSEPPDNISYSVLLSAISKGGGRHVFEKSKDLLMDMTARQIDDITKRQFLLCAKSCGKVDQAEAFLRNLPP